jgi:SAM-dependent methyltransferase
MSKRLSSVKAVAACPACGSARLHWRGPTARCNDCAAGYEAEDEIPILLTSAAPERAPSGGDPGLLDQLPERLRSHAQRAKRYARPSLTHRSDDTHHLTEAFVASLSREMPVLNVGAGTSNYGAEVLNLDIAPAAGIDVVGLAEQLPFRGEVFGGVVLQAVLEHVGESGRTLREIHRVLRPGGSLFVEVPFIQGYHPAPVDHRRYTEPGLRRELEQHGFSVDASGVAVGPASAMAWITAEFLALLLSGRSGRFYRFARIGTTWLAWPIKWGDAWLESHEMAHVIASGVWARAHKPAGAPKVADAGTD